MGIVERKVKEKQDLSKLILEASMEAFLEKGYDGISIRNIAEKIEYSPTTIYLYFKDKDAILYALHVEGFKIMNTKMQVLQYISDPFDRLIAMGRIYIDFAMENSQLYDLMFIQQAPIKAMACEEQDWEEGIHAFDGLRFTLQECIDKGYFTFNDTESAAFMIWASMHGMCALQIGNRCIEVLSEGKRDNAVNNGFQSFVEMMQALNRKKN